MRRAGTGTGWAGRTLAVTLALLVGAHASAQPTRLVPGGSASWQPPPTARSMPGDDGWPVLGRTTWRSGRVARPGFGEAVTQDGLGTRRWTASVDELGDPIAFLPEAGIVVSGGVALAVGFTQSDTANDRLFAFRTGDGSLAWSAPVPFAELDSWSTPAIDPENGVALVASGAEVAGIDLATGARAWTAPLEDVVVNASPVVTTDLGPRDRAFITDYGFLGPTGRLYCINVDPFDPVQNPFEPGEIVWTVALGAPTSGNSVAYRDGVIYVPVTGNFSGASPGGQILAFPADTEAAPEPLWVFGDGAGVGFFGGLTVTRDAVFAAGYGFGFGMEAGRLVKVDRASGQRVWGISANRTNATPVVLPDGRVLLVGGYEPGPTIPATGSVPSVALFRDLGDTVERVWDTATDTHDDANGNGVIDPGETARRLGGWLGRPAAVRDGDRWWLLCAEPALPDEGVGASGIGPSRRLVAIDPGRHPTDAAFVAAEHVGAGTAPALVGSTLYAIGRDGLVALALGFPGPGAPEPGAAGRGGRTP